MTTVRNVRLPLIILTHSLRSRDLNKVVVIGDFPLMALVGDEDQ
jgi:hypothetical protein